jgi:hypothetical protein
MNMGPTDLTSDSERDKLGEGFVDASTVEDAAQGDDTVSPVGSADIAQLDVDHLADAEALEDTDVLNPPLLEG